MSKQSLQEKNFLRYKALCIREIVVDDMYNRGAKSDKEKEYYRHELEDIRSEINNITACD